MKLRLNHTLYGGLLLASIILLLSMSNLRRASAIPRDLASSPDPPKAVASVFVDSGVSTLPGVRDGAVAWADYDSDGDLDALITGNTGSSLIAELYRKNSDNSYTKVVTLTGVSHSAVAWGDYNNDNKPDILITGQTTSTRISKVYRNDGNNTFTDIGAELTGVSDGSVAWGDYDNDGRQDILLAGATGTISITQIYHNNGNGAFTDSGVALPGIDHGTVAWGDYNNDGRLDILLTGADKTRIYGNIGNGTFTWVNPPIPLTDMHNSAAAWGDYNNDGKLDFVVTGTDTGLFAAWKVYRNDGGGVFYGLIIDIRSRAAWTSAAWGDYDNDGRLDILLNGDLASSYALKVFHNDGNNIFTPTLAGLPVITNGSFAWGDYNGNNTLDVLVAGQSVAPLTGIYSNTLTTPNAPPAKPTGLTASVVSRTVTLQWNPPNPPADDHTPPGGLTYNLRVGTTPGGANIITPLALPNGYRQVPALGNRQSMLTTTLSNLPRGRYYWSVQAIDTAFAGSPFANEATFVIPYYTYLPLVTNNSISYFEGPWEVEPNNTVDQANGSLRFDRAYNGYPDAKDYFYVDVQHPQPLSIDLVNHGGSGIQLQLKYRTITGMIFLTYDWQPPFHIDWNAQQPGLYYIYIFTETPPTVQTPYTLTVTSP